MNSTTNNTNNTPATFNTAKDVAAAMLLNADIAALFASLVQDCTTAKTNLDVKLFNDYNKWSTLSVVQQGNHNNNAFAYLAHRAKLEKAEDGKLVKGDEYTAFKKAVINMRTYAALQGLVSLISEDKGQLVNALTSKLAMVIDIYCTKGTTTNRRAMATTGQGLELIEMLVMLNTVVQTKVGDEIVYALAISGQDIVDADNFKVRKTIIKKAIQEKVMPNYKPMRSNKDIKLGSRRALDTRKFKDVFEFGKDTKASQAIIKAGSTKLKMANEFWTNGQAEVVIDEITNMFTKHRASKAVPAALQINGEDTMLLEFYRECITTIVMGIKGNTFYSWLLTDFAGRMYNTSLFSMGLKSIRSYVEVADKYDFCKASKIAAVAKLYTNLADQGKEKYMSLPKITAQYGAILNKVQAYAKDAVCTKKGKVDPLSRRLLASLNNGDTKVGHIVGLDVTNQVAQNVAVATHTLGLFNYAGVDLTNTAYNKLAVSFATLLKRMGEDGQEDLIGMLVNRDEFKYRFMTVFYNKAARAAVLGADKAMYTDYVQKVAELNKELHKKGRLLLSVVDYEDKLVDGTLAFKQEDTFITMMETMVWGKDSKGEFEVSNMNLPIYYMLLRNGFKIKAEFKAEAANHLVAMFKSAVDAVSPVAYRFADTYKQNFYGTKVAQMKTNAYYSVDGYKVLVHKKYNVDTTVVIPKRNGQEISVTVTATINSNLEKGKLQGSPRFMQSIDAAQARSAVMDANAVATMHDEYFFRLCDVEAGIANQVDGLVELYNTGIDAHFAEVNHASHDITPMNTIGDGELTEEIIRTANYTLWF